MRRNRRFEPIRAAAALLLAMVTGLAAGCSAAPTDPAAGATNHGGHGDGPAAAAGYGEPGNAADSARVIRITASDDLKFTPAAVEVAAGETVTFQVVNAGAIAHDFTLGDVAEQDHHGTEMASGDDHAVHASDNAFIVQPGETKALVWKFTAPGEVIYGCHTPGHYPAGMKGVVTVR
jgi:uncharacterized cupredoxin-like copper-binding protein